MLSRSQKYSHLAYLRTLASTHAETKRLIENLKFYCDKEVSLKDAADVNGLVTSASPDETLDRCMDDLFVPYTEGDRYLRKEVESLSELFGNIVSEFLSAMQRRKMTSSKNQSVLTRTLNQISSTSSAAGILSPSVSSPSALNELANQANTSTNPFEKKQPQAQQQSSRGVDANTVTVDDSGFTLLSPDAIMRILHIHAEAVIRCVELEDQQAL